MEASTAPTPGGKRPIEVGRVIDETFATYRAHAAPLIGSALAIYIVTAIIQGLLNGVLLGLPSLVVGLIATAIYTGFVVKLVEDVRDGRRDSSTGELLSSASHYIVPLIVNGI